jgi:hypothetical protein
MMTSDETRAERTRMVRLIRDWLKSDMRTTEEEIQRKLRAIGANISSSTTRHYCGKARILLNRELLFGADAERMFPTRGKRRGASEEPQSE